MFRPGTLTAAHRTLPFGTKVRVTNLWNGRSTVVRINDRGPFYGQRVIDLAHGAANQLGLIASGIAQVRLEVLRRLFSFFDHSLSYANGVHSKPGRCISCRPWEHCIRVMPA